jgi:hypothetical protein
VGANHAAFVGRYWLAARCLACRDTVARQIAGDLLGRDYRILGSQRDQPAVAAPVSRESNGLEATEATEPLIPVAGRPALKSAKRSGGEIQ